MKNIEVEIRSFISEEDSERLKRFMEKNATLEEEDKQITTYFSGGKDLRLQVNRRNAKVILKEGKIHDDHRKEIEIPFDKRYHNNMMDLITSLGYSIEIQWFRKRIVYIWENVNVALDNTRGYGHIIELESMCSEDEKVDRLLELKKLLSQLNIKETPKDVFDKRFSHYKNNWRELTKKLG